MVILFNTKFQLYIEIAEVLKGTVKTFMVH